MSANINEKLEEIKGLHIVEPYAKVDMSTAKPALVKSIIKAKLQLLSDETIKYDGLNKEQGYAFITKAQIWTAASKVLSENGVLVIPAYTRVSEDEFTSKSGTLMRLTKIIGNHTVTDGESHFVITTLGMAFDSADKGERKAQTDSRKVMYEQLLDISATLEEVDDTTTEPIAPMQKFNPKTGAVNGEPKKLTPIKPAKEDEPAAVEEAPTEAPEKPTEFIEQPKLNKISPKQKGTDKPKKDDNPSEAQEQPAEPQEPVREQPVAKPKQKPTAPPQEAEQPKKIEPIKPIKPVAPPAEPEPEVYDNEEPIENLAATADSEVLEVSADMESGLSEESMQFL